ncbi:hypothetical protein EDD16DRAFT_402526 [Pisolithus croceorrhizus]|nr:hypothetical protein EDD16DRAFT_402526 [Pisolithus croceorrhizus]
MGPTYKSLGHGQRAIPRAGKILAVMFVKSLVVVVAASALATQAQSTTATATASASSSTPSLSPCLLNCVTTAASAAGCSSFTDLSCVCTSTTFQSEAGACLTANCYHYRRSDCAGS